MFYAVLAEVFQFAKPAIKYILVKYKCTGMFFFVAVVVYNYNKTVILLTLVVYGRCVH